MSNMIGMECIVEIDENERYWVGKGFGKGGLLPNDRGAFSSIDGSLCWKSTKEASEDLLLLGRGWVYYKSGDDFLPPSDNFDEGWLYSNDFRTESINHAKPDRKTLHWVRFRRLVRMKVFHPDEFLSKDIYDKCDHCDSSVTDSLSHLLLDILAYCSLLHSTTQVTNAMLLPLKKTVIDLAISHEVPSDQSTDAFYQLDLLRKKLENFVEKERSNTAMSRLFSGVKYSFYGRNGTKEFKERCDAVAANCLPKNERDAIASLIVRKVDPHYQVHCDQVACGDVCRFARVQCSNDGCLSIMSKFYLETHDSTCPYKIIHCDCGDTFRANELTTHLSQACKLRTVVCPLRIIGCLKEVKACDLEQHIIEESTSHMLLAAGRVVEQEKEMKSLRDKVSSLETENRELSGSLQLHLANSTKEFGDLKARSTKVEKELQNFETKCQKEFKILNSPKHQIH